MANLKEAAT